MTPEQRQEIMRRQWEGMRDTSPERKAEISAEQQAGMMNSPRNALMMAGMQNTLHAQKDTWTQPPSRKVFCWLPRKVWAGRHMRDGGVWLRFAWLGDDGRYYREPT